MTASLIMEREAGWQDYYRAALFERNRSKVPGRIADAEKQIVARARELFKNGSHNVTERDALDIALYALRALKGSLNWKTRDRDPKSHSAVA